MAPPSLPAPGPSHLLRLLQRVLPVAMAVVLLAHGGGVLRLLPALQQPFGGVVLTWRKEHKLYAVGITPPHWTGITAGLRVNDRVLCIAGHRLRSHEPGAAEAIPGLDVLCPADPMWFSDIFREQATSGASSVPFTIQRQGVIATIPAVPLRRFTLQLLLDVYLLAVLHSLGFLVLGWVVYRAGSHAPVNLLFALWATVSSAFLVTAVYNIQITTYLENMRLVAMLFGVPWIPFWGVIFFALVSQLAESPRLAALTRTVTPLYALISLVFAGVGLTSYILSDSALGRTLDWPYISFVAGSSTLAIVWAILYLTWTWWRGKEARTRWQAGLLWVGVLLTVVSIFVPYLLNLFTDLPLTGALYHVVYVGPAAIAVMAYAIVRFQLIPVRSRLLDSLILTVFCTVIAGVIHLLLDPGTGFVALFLACLATAFGLQMGGARLRFLTRLLRREVLDYAALVDLSQQIGKLQDREALLAALRRAFAAHLDINTVQLWLFDPRDGNRAAVVAQMVRDTTPVPDASPAAQVYRLLQPDAAAKPVAVWAPLVDRGQAIGLLGLGPRWTGQGFESRDLELIAVLARQVALTLLNLQQLEQIVAASKLMRQAQEDERLKIARELHDTILQFLHVLTYGLNEIGEETPAVAPTIEDWQERISQEANRLRNLLSYLRAPELLVRQGVVTALRGWLDQVQGQTSIQLIVDLDVEAEVALTVDAQIAIYRAVREAVHNAVKYAQAQHIWVTLCRSDAGVTFVARDDGCGFDMAQALAATRKGYSSLRDMQEYAESVGGTLTIDSMPGHGTEVRGDIPGVGNERAISRSAPSVTDG